MSAAQRAPRSPIDVVVIGTGSGGKVAALELGRQGLSVVAVEAGRVGGECPYVACVPAKSLLLTMRSGLTWAQAVRRRDEVTNGRDDAGARQGLIDDGVDVLRGRARLGPPRDGVHVVVVAGVDGRERVLTAPIVVIGTGSSPTTPPIPGLADVATWTSVDALSADSLPARLLILGGGAVGCELGQAFSGLGSVVTVVERAPRLLPGETPWVGELVADVLRAGGVDVRVGVEAERADLGADGRSLSLRLAGGETLVADRLLLAGGREANSAGLGLEHVGAALDDARAIRVDARCRVVDDSGAPIRGLFAVGDVTPDSAFTHSANYQARIVADQVAGVGHDADYSAIPRAVYIDPAVFCVGLTPAQAADAGIAVATAGFDVGEVERALLLRHAGPPPGESSVYGRVELVADAGSGVLIGAACVGPDADSWGGELALAIRARVDVHTLSQHVRAFPTWSEAIYPAVCSLDSQLRSALTI